MTDPTGTLISELRDANVAGGRVRGFEPAPAANGYEGDALGPGRYKRFVVLIRLGVQRLLQTSVAEVRIGYRCYGVTPQDAAALAGELSDQLHLRGGRAAGASGWIYQSIDETGGAASKDPDTDQPYESGVITLLTST